MVVVMLAERGQLHLAVRTAVLACIEQLERNRKPGIVEQVEIVPVGIAVVVGAGENIRPIEAGFGVIVLIVGALDEAGAISRSPDCRRSSPPDAPPWRCRNVSCVFTASTCG
jgi:hypothetical protein